MKQITAQIYQWSQYAADEQIDRHGHFVQAPAGQPGVLIDPVAFHAGDEAQVRDLGGAAAVVLTRYDRAPEAARCRDAFGCRALVPAGCLAPAGLEGAEPLAPGMDLPAGLKVVAVSDDPPPAWPGAVALYHGPSGTGILGGAVAGAPAGELSLAHAEAADGGAAAARAARSLRALLGYWLRPPGRALVAQGEAILRDAERAIQDLVYKSDPAAFLLRSGELVWQAPREKGSRFSRRSAECSRVLGLKVLDFEVTAVPPGKQSTLLHRHDGLEEAFIVLQGAGEVLTERGAFPIAAGDVLSFPPRYQVAHTIRNTGDGELRFLALGAFAEPSEAVGLAEYPESNKQFQWVPGKFRLFYLPENLRVDYWEGERLD